VVADNWIVAQSIATVAQAIAAVGAILVAVPSIISAAKQVRIGAEQARIAAEASRAAAEQSGISARAASASALGVISATSRELQWKVLEDPALQPILTGSAHPLDDETKRETVRAMLINFYAFVYEFRELRQIPETSWQAYKSDMTDFFTQAPNKARWNSVKKVFPGKFQEFIEHEILNRPR